MRSTAEEAPRFGRQLRQLREAAGLTQAELAERAGRSANSIAALESGRRQRPHPSTVRALAEALGLSEEQRANLMGIVSVGGEAPALHAETATARPATVRLPPAATDLIGRERDLDALGDLFRRGARLMTIIGPSGVGKTSFAVRFARDSTDPFPDGVAFVHLAPLTDEALLLPTVAQILGLREASGQTPRDVLHAYLADRRLLLVLDNLEHVLDAAPDLAELVASADGLHVLATSRTPLRVRGEREYHLQPLPVPEFGRIPNAEEAAESPAVRLFAERAGAVAPGFELTQSNAAAVTAICRRLDGLPLAIELAAARLRTLSPTELLARLDRSLPLLTGGPRDLPERQRTMRSTIEWSYQLLDEPQGWLMNRLSVFRGGWDLEAAEAVGAGGDILREQVFDLLSSLVEQSLVVAEAREESATHYRMLAPVREYAEERLEQSGEAEETSFGHAEYFMLLAEANFRSQTEEDRLARAEREHGNTREAMRWALSRGEAALAGRLAVAMMHVWRMHGHVPEARAWFAHMLRLRDGLSPDLRGKVLWHAGLLAIEQGEYESAQDTLDEAAAVFRQLGDTRDKALALGEAGFVRIVRGHYDEARPCLEECLALSRRMNDELGMATALNGLGEISRCQGDYGQAESLYTECLQLFAKGGFAAGQASSLANLGLNAAGQGDYSKAGNLFRRAAALAHEHGADREAVNAISGLAGMAGAHGQGARAGRLWGATRTAYKANGITQQPQDLSAYLHHIRAAREAAGDAAWEAAVAEGEVMTLDEAVAYALSTGEEPYDPSGHGTIVRP